FIAASGANDTLSGQAEAARQRSLRALEDYRSFLQDELLARSHGDYHLGRERFARRIAVTEGITDSPEVLRERARHEIERLRSAVERIAHRVAPHQSAARTMARLNENHPSAA